MHHPEIQTHQRCPDEGTSLQPSYPPPDFSFPSDCQLQRLTARIFQHQVVLIGGPTAAGKTAFAGHLVEALNRDWQAALTLLRLDRYFKIKSERPRKQGHCDLDSPAALQFDWLESDLRDLMAGTTVDLPVYWDNLEAPDGVSKRRSGTLARLKTGHPLVIESIFALNGEIGSLLQGSSCLRVFIDAPEKLRLVRRIVREEKNGDARAEQVMNEWPALREAEQEHIYPALKTADIVIENRDISGLFAPARFYLERALERAGGSQAGRFVELLRYLDRIYDEQPI